MTVKTLDFNRPADAREYIAYFRKEFTRKTGKIMTNVTMSDGAELELDTLTDADARIIASEFHEMDLAAKGYS